MQVNPEAAGQQCWKQGCSGLHLAHPGDVERHQLVHSSQHCNGHIKALELERRVAHQKD